MLELLKGLAVKISEAYDKLFKTWARIIIFFAAYFTASKFLPDALVAILMILLLVFIFIGLFGRELKRKGPKS